MTHKYTIHITEREYRALAYMSAEGYDCGMFDAITNSEVECVNNVYSIPEHVIWPASEAYNKALECGDEPWGPFAEWVLQSKMDDLMLEVV